MGLCSRAFSPGCHMTGFQPFAAHRFRRLTLRSATDCSQREQCYLSG